MKRAMNQRRVSRVLFGLATTTLLLSACASDSSPSSDGATNDTSSGDTVSSTPRERNAIVGGFGTDGSGFVNVPLVGTSWSYKDQLTLRRNADGSSNVAFIELGSKEGVPFNTLVQARLLASGIFDASFGQGGFVKTEISDERVQKILFDSKGNPFLWTQTYVEIPNSGATEEENNWKEINRIHAYTFGASTPNTNYGTAGVIVLDDVAPKGIAELVVGSRGATADGLIFSRYSDDKFETVSLTPAGQIDSSAANGGVNAVPEGQHDFWESRLIDTSTVVGSDDAQTVGVAGVFREAGVKDCPPDEYCPGPVAGFDYDLSNSGQPLAKGSTTEVDDLLDGGVGEVAGIFAASGGTSSKNTSSGNMVSAQSADMKNKLNPVELIVVARNNENQSVTRGVLNSVTKNWESVTHFSFYNDDKSAMRVWDPAVAPTGQAVVAFYDNYDESTNGLIACNAQLGVCDVKNSAFMVYSKDLGNWPNLSSIQFDAEGKIHALVRGLTVAESETDAVVDLASDGLPTSAQIELITASLWKDNAAGVVSWTPFEWGAKLGGKNTMYVGGTLADETPSQGTVPGIATLTKTQNSRSVVQERTSRPNLPGVVIDSYSDLLFDAAGNEYVRAWKEGNSGFVRLLPGSKAIDQTYGVGGYAQIGLGRPNKCAYVYFEVANSGQAMGAMVESDWDSVLKQCSDTRRVASVVALTSSGVAEDVDPSNSSLVTQDLLYNDTIFLSIATKEVYVVNDRWVESKNQDDRHLVSVRRYDLAGKLDKTFGTAGILSYDENSPLSWVNVAAVDNEGRLIFAAIDQSDTIDLRLARLKRDGALDAGVDVPPPPVPNPGELRAIREEQEQEKATAPVPQPQQQPAGAFISGTRALADGNIEVSWVSGAESTNATFTVTASPGGKTCSSTATSCVVRGLDAWQKYTFTVSQAGAATQSSASAEIQPVRMVKVGSRVSAKRLLNPGSKGAAMYAVTGGCKLLKSTTLVASRKVGSCLLSVKTAKVGKTAASTRSVRIQIVAALPK